MCELEQIQLPCGPIPICSMERLIWEEQRRHFLPAEGHFVSEHTYRMSVVCACEGSDLNIDTDASKTLEDRPKDRCRTGSRRGHIIGHSLPCARDIDRFGIRYLVCTFMYLI